MKHGVLLFLEFHAVMSKDQRILSCLEATVVLFLDSPLEPFRLLLRRRVEQFIHALQFPLPRVVLAFDCLAFAFPIQN